MRPWGPPGGSNATIRGVEVLSGGIGQFILVLERRHRDAWTRYREVDIYGDDVVTPFRRTIHATTYVVPERGRAPLRVRVVAIGSMLMGQMSLPGIVVATFGMIFFGLGTIGIPGIILACWIWRDGLRLLEANPQVVKSAEKTATFAYVLNLCVVPAVFAMVALAPDMFWLGLFTLVYAAVSFAHATMLKIAADDVRQHLQHRQEATAWKPAVPAASAA